MVRVSESDRDQQAQGDDSGTSGRSPRLGMETGRMGAEGEVREGMLWPRPSSGDVLKMPSAFPAQALERAVS